MNLWNNGSEDGDVLLVGTQADIAPTFGIPGDSVMLFKKQPVDDLLDEVGERQVRALVRLLVKLLRPAAFQDDAILTLRPRGTWRILESQTYVFIVVNGERIVKTAEEWVAGVDAACILADRVDGHWVLR